MSVSSVSSSGFDQLVPVLASENAATAAAARREEMAQAAKPAKELGMFQEKEPSFADFLDVINPLQHIPILNSIYRELTGDEIGVGPRLVGGALFGGPIGLAAAAVNSVTEAATGSDVGGHMIALFKSDTPAAEPATAVAAAEKAADRPAAGDKPPAEGQADAQAVIMPELAGEAPPPPAPAAAPAPAPVEQVAQAPAPAAEARPMAAAEPAATRPMPSRDARMMPAPGRNASAMPKQLANVTVPLSNSGARTNVPVTGAHTTNGAINPALVQQMMAAQAQAGRTDSAAVAAPGSMMPAQGQDAWFSGAMLQALDKYERSAKLGQQAATSVPPVVPAQ